jgi:hypothetical protein
MYKIECNICGVKFESEFIGREKGNLSKHLRHKHKDITKEEYLTKYYYNNVRPLCGCGCGKETDLYKFNFHKYFMNHKNYVPLTEDVKNKIRLGSTQNILSNRIKLVGTSEEILTNSLNKYKTCEFSMSEIAREIKLDRRTLKKFWIELSLVNNYELTKLNKLTKFIGIKNNIKDIHINLDEYLKKILLFIDINNNVKHTINQVRNELNIPFSSNYLLTKLREKYGDEVLSYFRMGGKSNLEIDFFNILRFYFGERVQLSFKVENRYFDYILDGKLLIELDGSYWHSSEEAKENDKYKNGLAIKNGFQILRINENNIKDINILIKIKNIADKI